MSWAEFFGWTVLSLQKVARTGIAAVAPSMLIQVDGSRLSADETHEEWCRVHVLQAHDEQARGDEWIGSVMLQVSVFSRFGDDRSDKDSNRPRKLAGLIAGQIANRAHDIMDYDEASPTAKGQVFLRSPGQVYLDESKLGQTGVNQSVPSGIHGVAMTFHGRANKY